MTYLSGRDQRRTPRRQAAHGLRARLLLLISLTAVASLALGGNAVHANPRPVAAYSFDEGSGATVSDSAGGHDGTIEGATWTTSGKYGSALSFDGEDDLVSIADGADLDLTGSFTLEAWVSPDDFSTTRPVISKVGFPETGASGYQLEGNTGKPLGRVAASGTVKGVEGAEALPTEETWSHVALTSDGATLRLYVNGALEKSGEGLAAVDTAATLKIGNGFGGWFDGLIDEVRLYDEALSESQIETDRDTAVGLDQIPVAAYSFDEGSGTTLGDSVGDHDGTIEGATWTSNGKYGSALDFDGVDDLVSIADASSLDLTSSFTLEAWVRPDSLAAARPVISKIETSGGNSGYMLSAKHTSNAVGYVASSGTAAEVSASTALPSSSWSHLAATSDGTTLRLYIDGKLVATKAAISVKATSAGVEIGHSALGGYFDGQVDEVRIYNVALSESQIQIDRDNCVEPPPSSEVTANVLDTGPSSELVSSVPITSTGTETVVYSLPIPSIKFGEVLRATGNLEVTNKKTYDITDAVRIVLGPNPSDGSGTVVTPWSRVLHTPDMLHWTLPINGVYRADANAGTTQYLKVVLKASSASAKAGDTLIVQPNFGRLAATRYTPAPGPMAQPTHQLQPLIDSMPEKTTSVPVDSSWQLILSRKVSDLAAGDILDLTGQLEAQNTSGATVQLESMIKMNKAATTTGSTATTITNDRLTPSTSLTRLVHSGELDIADPAKRYLNLLVRAVPVSGTPQPLTVTTGSASLNVVQISPSPGEPTAPIKEGIGESLRGDGTPDVSSIPFAVAGGSQKRVVASTPIYDGLAKGEVIRARGLITADLNGGEVAQVLTQLIIADGPTDTSGDIVAGLSGDKVPASMQVHTSVKEGTYVVPEAIAPTKRLNFVVYASQANPSGSMSVLNAAASYSSSMPTTPLDEGFEEGLSEDGLDSVYEFEFNGPLAASSTVAREGSKSLVVNVNNLEDYSPDRPGVRRVEARPPDYPGAGGNDGAESWYGFSVYFPDGFNAPDPDPGPHYEGLLDEVRLYDQTLSQSEIEADRDGEYGGGAAPVAVYGFEEGSGLTVGDSAGSNDGVISGNAAWVESGKYGSALSFDGINDAVIIPDSADLDFTDSFTLEAWVKPSVLTSLVPVINKTQGAFAGYGLVPSFQSKPTGFVGNGSTVAAVGGFEALSTTAWSHLAFTSDGTTLALYVNGQLVKTGSAIQALANSDDLVLGGPSLNASGPKVSTWNTFTQWKLEGDLGCEANIGVPVGFTARHYLAGAHTNPGETETATPVAGEYIAVEFNGGEVSADCQDIAPTVRFVLAPLERNRWYDFVQHTRWTPEQGGPGNSVTEIWMDGVQVLGNESTPVSTPSFFWHGSLENHTTSAFPQFGLYRGPSLEDPTSQLYIDAVRSGNSYGEVEPGQ